LTLPDDLQLLTVTKTNASNTRSSEKDAPVLKAYNHPTTQQTSLSLVSLILSSVVWHNVLPQWQCPEAADIKMAYIRTA
jgi:hypothetical protein